MNRIIEEIKNKKIRTNDDIFSYIIERSCDYELKKDMNEWHKTLERIDDSHQLSLEDYKKKWDEYLYDRGLAINDEGKTIRLNIRPKINIFGDIYPDEEE